MMPFLYNAWYMLGWSDEIADGAIARQNCSECSDRCLARSSVFAGSIALEDRCPHRFAPLSRGTLVDGNIQCGYHGLTFNTAGQCIRNVFAKSAPAAAAVRSFPISERPGTIWVWMGDAARADEIAYT